MTSSQCKGLILLASMALILWSPTTALWAVDFILPDTGQTRCYDNDGEIPCPSSGEPFYGQDAHYGGLQPAYQDNGDGTVTDLVTGLMWKVKTDEGYTWNEASAYCEDLTLGGHADWRLPEIDELETLVDYGKYLGLAIDTSYFPNTVASSYWSSTATADNTDGAWYVYFDSGDGSNGSNGSRSSRRYARCVRGGQGRSFEHMALSDTSDNRGAAAQSFKDERDGTVSDTDTRLLWQKQNDEVTRPWQEALAYCENLTLAGYDDWRLPDIRELKSIVDYSTFSPAINTSYFPNTVSAGYWSSTTRALYTDRARYVYFSSGNDDIDGKSGSSYVRCVRGGQGSPFDHWNLTVTKIGTGNGKVTSGPAGVDCGGDCAHDYANGTQVVLTAAADAGSVFAGWSGACSGANFVCRVTMNTDNTATANFEPAPVHPALDFDKALFKVFTYTGNINSLASSDGTENLWVGSGGGLEKLDADTGLRLQLWTTSNGLPGNRVRCLAKDPVGGIWIGTDGGLAYMTRNEKLTIYSQDNSELPCNDVQTLSLDHQEGLWIGTFGCGLAHLSSEGDWTIYQHDNSGLPNDDVEYLSLDDNDELWIGMDGGSIAHLNKHGDWNEFDTSDAGIDSYYFITGFASDGMGGVWVGTDGRGVAHLSANDKWTVYNIDNSDVPSNYVQSLSIDENGELWVATNGSGIAYLTSEGAWHKYDISNSDLPTNYVNNIFFDDQNRLWISDVGILAYLDLTGKWTTYVVGNSDLPGTFSGSLSPDGFGGVWIRTLGGIANLAPTGEWSLFSSEELNRYGSTSFVSNDRGGLWIRAAKGMLVPILGYQVEMRLYYLSADLDLVQLNFYSNDIHDFCSDGQGGLWVGTGDSHPNHGTWGVLAHLTAAGSLTKYYASTCGLPDYVTSVASDGQAGVWVSTVGGLAHLSAGRNWTAYTNENSVSFDYLNDGLLSDGQFGVWIGDEGLRLSAGGELSTVDQAAGINDACTDGQGGQWIGTSSGLLHVNADHQWTVFSLENSDLPMISVEKLAPDGQQGVWIANEDVVVHLGFGSDISQNLVPVYRFFSTQTGSHFYTIDPLERDQIISHYNWLHYEGIAYYAIDPNEPPINSVPVYRFFNTDSGSHFFTIDEAEKNHIIANYDWFRYEGEAWYAFSSNGTAD